MSLEILASRTLSAFPLSIGTSLAFESIFTGPLEPYDPERVIPNKVYISNYNLMLINIDTILRNIINALPKDTLSGVGPESLADTMYSEIDTINSILKNEGGNVCIPFYYYADYSAPKRLDGPVYQIKKPKTPLQHEHINKVNATMVKFFKKYKNLSIPTYSDKIEYKARLNVLLLSHHPYDLLSGSNFNRLDLLESFTGKLKERNEWYTKFHKIVDTDISYIPFLKKFLVAFGDGILYNPWPHKARAEILRVAKIGHWTYATTNEKCKLDMDVYSKDRYLVDTLLSIK